MQGKKKLCECHTRNFFNTHGNFTWVNIEHKRKTFVFASAVWIKKPLFFKTWHHFRYENFWVSMMRLFYYNFPVRRVRIASVTQCNNYKNIVIAYFSTYSHKFENIYDCDLTDRLYSRKFHFTKFYFIGYVKVIYFKL